MSVKGRWLTVLLTAVHLLALDLISVAAAPFARTNSPPQQPYLWPETIVSAFEDTEITTHIAYNRKHNEYLVVWQKYGATEPGTVRGARISGSGQMLANFQIHGHSDKASKQPAVAYDPVHDRYLVVFLFGKPGTPSNTDLVGRFIPWDGPDAALEPFVIADWPSYQETPDVAYGRAEEEFLVVWANQYASGYLPRYISGRRIRAADGSFPGSNSDITIDHPLQHRNYPAVTYNLARNEYLVVYDNELDIMGTRFTGTLNHDFGGEFPIANSPDMENKADVATCCAIDQYVVTWQSLSGNDQGIFGRFISGSGVMGTVHEIYDAVGHDRAATVACADAGMQYLFAWQSLYASRYSIWARLMQPDGQMSAPFALHQPTAPTHHFRPAVAGGGSSYMAVWEQERKYIGIWDIHGRLISPYASFFPVMPDQ